MTLAAPEIWVCDSMSRVFPDSEPPANQSTAIRLYMAQGERESFQIAVRAGDEPASRIHLTGEAFSEHIPSPEFRRVGFVQTLAPSERAIETRTVWPDPLPEFRGLALGPNTTGAIWVTYRTSRNTQPGIYHGEVELRYGRRGRQSIPVTIEVFDYMLPRTPSLRSMAEWNQAKVGEFCEVGVNLGEWRPIYDLLGEYPFSFQIGPPEFLSSQANPGMPFDWFQAQLDYASHVAHMNTIHLGSGSVIDPAVAHAPPDVGPPLVQETATLADWLERERLLDKAVIEVGSFPARRMWPRIREQAFAWRRILPGAERLLVGPLTPFFEEDIDVYSIPLGDLHPDALDLMRRRRSLAYDVAYPANEVLASSVGRPELDTAADAYDGCLFTGWKSRDGVGGDQPHWLQIEFREPVSENEIRIAWEDQSSVTEVEVYTSYAGRQFSHATVDWDIIPAGNRFAFTWSEGLFKVPKTFVTLRLEFPEASRDSVEVLEVAFSDQPVYEPLSREAAIEPWFYAPPSEYPSMALDVPLMEYRVSPWLCWAYDVDGFTGLRFNEWSFIWSAASYMKPLVWPAAPNEENALFYPTRGGLVPSIRAELLRDGFEDYELVNALDTILRERNIEDTELTALTRRQWYSTQPRPNLVDEWTEEFMERRVAIGRALTELAE